MCFHYKISYAIRARCRRHEPRAISEKRVSGVRGGERRAAGVGRVVAVAGRRARRRAAARAGPARRAAPQVTLSLVCCM